MTRRDVDERHDQILRELTEERAAALLRISRTLESLIDQLHAVRQHLGQADEGSREHERRLYTIYGRAR